MPPVAKRASEEALDLLNRAIKNKRSLSEFEKRKIESHLNSAKKIEQMEYHTASACYYAHIADIESLMICADYVFSREHDNAQAMNVLFALYNTYQYKKIVELLDLNDLQFSDDEDYISYIDISLSAYAICNEFDKVGGIMEKVDKRIAENISVQHAFFFASNIHENFISSEDRSELSNYLLDALNIYGKTVVSSYRDEIGEASLEYRFFEDEGIKLFDLKFSFDSENEDAVFKAEDDFLSNVARLNYKSSVRSKVSFSFESNSGGEND